MSVGYGGFARIALRDNNIAIYEYAPFNLNYPEYRNNDRIHDGIITINVGALVEPEIHEKIRRMPSGRKKLVAKRILSDVDYNELILQNHIKIENSRFCWQTTENGAGVIAMKIIRFIFEYYQENGEIPETVSLMS